MSLKINILQENINSLKINYIPLGNVKQSIPHLFFPEKKYMYIIYLIFIVVRN